MASVADERSSLKFNLAITLLQTIGEARLAVAGASMLPSLWPGDILEIHHVSAESVFPGDVVVFARANRLVVHRVLQVRRDADNVSIVTRGDRVARLDSPVSASELLGRVKIIRRGNQNIDPQMADWMRAASWILRRSELCTRALLRLDLFIRKFSNSSHPSSLTPETAWAS